MVIIHHLACDLFLSACSQRMSDGMDRLRSGVCPSVRNSERFRASNRSAAEKARSAPPPPPWRTKTITTPKAHNPACLVTKQNTIGPTFHHPTNNYTSASTYLSTLQIIAMSTPGAPSATPAADATSTAPIPIIRGVEYRCGDCGARNVIKGGDPVRCRQCGFRILYKTRTKRCKNYRIPMGG